MRPRPGRPGRWPPPRRRCIEVAHDDPLFEQALTHRSFANEKGGLPAGQGLAFVGEAALRMSITDIVFHRRPQDAEAP
ncbi:hypothetical protein ACQEU6_20820 [Spirillospora sp. CA-108201]